MDVQLRETAIKSVPAPVRDITVKEIKKAVTKYYSAYYGFEICADDLCSRSIKAEHANPRQIAMWLARELTIRSLPSIGRKFGDRDHATVLHGVWKIEGDKRGYRKSAINYINSAKNTLLRRQAREIKQGLLSGATVLPAPPKLVPRTARQSKPKNKHLIEKIAERTAEHYGLAGRQMKDIACSDPDGRIWLAQQTAIYVARSLGHTKRGIARYFSEEFISHDEEGRKLVASIAGDVKSKIGEKGGEEWRQDIVRLEQALSDCARIKTPVIPGTPGQLQKEQGLASLALQG